MTAPAPGPAWGGGSFATRRASAGLAGKQAGTRYSLAASGLDSDGQPLRRGGADKGYDNGSGFLRIGHRFANQAQAGLLFLHAAGNTEYENGEDDFAQQVAGVYGQLPLTGNWTSHLALSEARDQRDSRLRDQDQTTRSRYHSRTRTAHWQNDFPFGRHELIAGMEYSKDSLDSDQSFRQSSRDNKAAFVQGLFDWKPWQLQASLRHDRNQAYGDKTTGSLALGYYLDRQHVLRASYGSAFRAPTFNDLYSPMGSNPDIRPEKSKSVELGIRGQFNRGYWDLAGYQSDYDDLISWVPDAAGLYGPENVHRARIRGLELSSAVTWEKWTLKAAATYMQPKDRDNGRDLARRARQSLRLDADQALSEAVSLGGSLTLQGKRYDDAANHDPLSGAALLDVRAGWRFAPAWEAQLQLNNALDKQYQTARGYINAGRGLFLSLNFTPNH